MFGFKRRAEEKQLREAQQLRSFELRASAYRRLETHRMMRKTKSGPLLTLAIKEYDRRCIVDPRFNKQLRQAAALLEV